MFRTIVRIQMLVFLLPLLIIGAVVALVLTGQPELSDARDVVDARWSELRGPLADRYAKLGDARQVFAENGGQDRDIARDLEEPLRRWRELTGRQPGDADHAAEVAVANQLEAGGARLAANVNTFDRFRSKPAVAAALASFQSTAPSKLLQQAYNRAVRHYEDDRNQWLRRPVAVAFGFDARPLLLLA